MADIKSLYGNPLVDAKSREDIQRLTQTLEDKMEFYKVNLEGGVGSYHFTHTNDDGTKVNLNYADLKSKYQDDKYFLFCEWRSVTFIPSLPPDFDPTYGSEVIEFTATWDYMGEHRITCIKINSNNQIKADDYEDDFLIADKKYVDAADSQLFESITEISDNVNSIVTISKNLIDPSKCLINLSPNYTNAVTPITDDSAVKTTNNYITSNVIECEEGDVFTVTGLGYLVNFYGADADGKYNTAFQLTMTNTTFTIPSGVSCFRFRFTSPSSTDVSWKTSFMLVKGSTLPSAFEPYGETKLNPNIVIPKVTRLSDVTYKDTTKGIFLITFDGLLNGYDYVVQKLKENNLPFTLFTDTSDNTMIGKIKRDIDENMDVQLYNSQPAVTYEGASNYIEQYGQYKNAYDNYMKIGIGTPKFVAYSGGRHNAITDGITKSLNLKYARDTSGVYTDIDLETLIIKSSQMFTSNYSGVIPYALNTAKNYNGNCCVITHGIDDSGADFHLTTSLFDSFVSSCVSYREQGVLFMTFTQFFEYMTFPHGASKGDHVMKLEGDGKEHEYVFDGLHWREITM